MGKKLPPSWEGLQGSSLGKRCWRFAWNEFDEHLRELRVHGQIVAVQPRPLDCLAVLLRSPDKVVTKEQLLTAVWRGRQASDAVVVKCINKLRHAIGYREQLLIKTVHGHGYILAETPVVIPRRRRTAVPVTGQDVPEHGEYRLEQQLSQSLWRAKRRADGEICVIRFARRGPELEKLRRLAENHRLSAGNSVTRLLVEPLILINLDRAPFFVACELTKLLPLPEWMDQMRAAGLLLSRGERIAIAVKLASLFATLHGVGVDFAGALSAGCIVVAAEDVGADTMRLRLMPCAVEAQESNGKSMDGKLEIEPDGTLAAHADVSALGKIILQLVLGDMSLRFPEGWQLQVDDQELVRLLEDVISPTFVGATQTSQQLAERLKVYHLSLQASPTPLEMGKVSAAFERIRRNASWHLYAGATLLAFVFIGLILY